MGHRAHGRRAARRRVRWEQRGRRQDRSDTGGGGGGGGGNLVVGTIEVPSSIDPANVYEKFASDVLFNTTNRLVEYPPGATEPEPGLATDWEISDDGLTYTFTLRDGVKFQDGSDFDSEDVKYSFERAINVNDPDGASFLLQTRDEESGEPSSGIASIETPDPMTVVITLVAANTTFLSRLNYTVASIVPSDGDYKAPDEVLTGDVAGQLADWENTDSIVGTGPYELQLSVVQRQRAPGRAPGGGQEHRLPGETLRVGHVEERLEQPAVGRAEHRGDRDQRIRVVDGVQRRLQRGRREAGDQGVCNRPGQGAQRHVDDVDAQAASGPVPPDRLGEPVGQQLGRRRLAQSGGDHRHRVSRHAATPSGRLAGSAARSGAPVRPC